MAKIVHSEAAPSEAVHYSFAGVEFDLGGRKKGYDSDDPTVLANAESHPWLRVERPEVEVVAGAYVEQLSPEEDHLTAAGHEIDPNDPAEAKRAEEAKVENNITPVAIDSGLDQDEVVETDGVAQTIAADKENTE